MDLANKYLGYIKLLQYIVILAKHGVLIQIN